MIFLKNFETKQNYTFEITKFPDNTTQFWRIKPEPKKGDKIEITWQFENESELVTILQAHKLLSRYGCSFGLYMPFLPYGRQDKAISNDTTFAKEAIFSYLEDYIHLSSFDVHSADGASVFNRVPDVFHAQTIFESEPDFLCFPDLGAKQRYANLHEHPLLIMDKKRNQETGEIEGLVISYKDGQIKDKKILIIDDICDGGRTFIEAAKLLKQEGASQIDLCVSHGIFSKGKQVLHDAGIKNIYTTNSLPQNAGQFNVLF